MVSRIQYVPGTFLFPAASWIIVRSHSLLYCCELREARRPGDSGCLPQPHGGQCWYNDKRHPGCPRPSLWSLLAPFCAEGGRDRPPLFHWLHEGLGFLCYLWKRIGCLELYRWRSRRDLVWSVTSMGRCEQLETFVVCVWHGSSLGFSYREYL